MLECNVILPFFAHNIWLWLNSLYLFICLIQIQNTEIYTVYHKSAKKYRDIHRIPQISQKIQRYKCFLISPSPKPTHYRFIYKTVEDGLNI